MPSVRTSPLAGTTCAGTAVGVITKLTAQTPACLGIGTAKVAARVVGTFVLAIVFVPIVAAIVCFPRWKSAGSESTCTCSVPPLQPYWVQSAAGPDQRSG